MKGNRKKLALPAVIALAYAALAIRLPETAERSLKVTLDYALEILLIVPPVFILMGLMEVWIPKDKVRRWLGKGSGARGAVISVLMGTLPAGPLYVAFPMAAALIRKGAGVVNMVLFLGAWAALKIPQLITEIKFLGLSFALARFVLTLAALLLTGLLMDVLLRRHPDTRWLESSAQEGENPGVGRGTAMTESIGKGGAVGAD